MSKKPVEVIIPDEALAAFPPEDRERVREEIREMFEGFDPENPPEDMREVVVLPEGVSECLSCKTPVRKVQTMTLPEDAGGETLDLFECPRCDIPYERIAAN